MHLAGRAGLWTPGRKGRLAVGHDADILAVLGNPLDDPSTLHRINAVFVRGTRLEHIPN